MWGLETILPPRHRTVRAPGVPFLGNRNSSHPDSCGHVNLSVLLVHWLYSTHIWSYGTPERFSLVIAPNVSGTGTTQEFRKTCSCPAHLYLARSSSCRCQLFRSHRPGVVKCAEIYSMSKAVPGTTCTATGTLPHISPGFPHNLISMQLLQ